MKSYSKPTDDLVDKAVPLLSSPEHQRHFFDKLDNPHWIQPLKEREFFKYPPSAVPIQDGGVQHISWPASKYLARMAKFAPNEVAQIFTEMETNNASVAVDMLDGALAMPTEFAATLMPALCKTIDSGLFSLDLEASTSLCIRLASEGQGDAALRLADCLFKPTFAIDGDTPRRTNKHFYMEGLKRIIPALVAARSAEFLRQMCTWLLACVEAKNGVNKDTGYDLSFMWRPAIEEHEQNSEFDFAGLLVSRVREAFELAISDRRVTLDASLLLLNRDGYLVFKRLRLHLINAFAEQVPELARTMIMDASLFDAVGFKHEYAMLLGRRFSMLEQQERVTWFGWVEAGPSKDELDAQTPDADRQSYVEYWQFEHLHCVRDHLDGKWRDFYREKLSKYGEPKLADFHVWSDSPQWGDESPFDLNQLTGLPFAEGVAKVSSWKPDKTSYFGPNVRGLAGTFAQYVATNLEGFSKEASALRDCHPIFVRTFIDELTKAIEAGKNVELQSVFELCRWVLAQPLRQGKNQGPDWDGEDADWQWTRNAISRFLKAICDAKTQDDRRYAASTFRGAIWELLEPLTRDPAQTVIFRNGDQQDVRLQDYLMHAINSPRGKAVDAALSYARWIALGEKLTQNGQKEIPGGFDAMPEVRTMLDWQIAQGNQSPEAGALIGAHIDLIYSIDRSWLAINSDKIFDLRAIETDYGKTHGWAAWNAFLIWVQPHIEFYRLFKPQFTHTVEQSFSVKPLQESDERPMDRLGEHLMLLYGRGQLGLNDDAGLLKEFLTRSTHEFRFHAIEFVGISLVGEKKVPQDVIERFMKLWDWFWPVTAKEAGSIPSARRLFGYWFHCGKFPEDWCVRQFEEFVQVVGIPDPDYDIVEQLAEVGDANILPAIRALDRMIRADKEGWRTYGWRQNAKKLLLRAMKPDNAERGRALQLINYLGRRGYAEFGELLKQ
jgi:hypothetical protein